MPGCRSIAENAEYAINGCSPSIKATESCSDTQAVDMKKKMNRTKLYKLVNQLVNYETYSLLNRPCVMLVPCTTNDVIGRQPLINQNGRRKTHRKGKVDWKIQCKPCCTTNPFVSNIYIQYLRGFRRNMYTENKTLSWILSLHTYHFISYSLLIEYLRDCAMRLILCVHLTQCDCAMR